MEGPTRPCDRRDFAQLQRSKELFDHFGSHHLAHRPSAHISTLYDVLVGLPLDIAIGEANDSDRAALVPLLTRIRKGDVLLLDRGYPSFDDLTWLVSEGLDFVVRVKLDMEKCIRAFAESGAAEGVVVLRPTATSELQEGEIELRIVRAGAPDGEPLFLLTNLDHDAVKRTRVRPRTHRVVPRAHATQPVVPAAVVHAEVQVGTLRQAARLPCEGEDRRKACALMALDRPHACRSNPVRAAICDTPTTEMVSTRSLSAPVSHLLHAEAQAEAGSRRKAEQRSAGTDPRPR